MRHSILVAVMLLVAFVSQVSAERSLTDYQDYESCNTWDYDYTSNYKYYGGTLISTVASATVAKCSDLCIEDDSCYTFNFYKRRCYMFEEHDEGLNTKPARGYTAGYTYCADKK